MILGFTHPSALVVVPGELLYLSEVTANSLSSLLVTFGLAIHLHQWHAFDNYSFPYRTGWTEITEPSAGVKKMEGGGGGGLVCQHVRLPQLNFVSVFMWHGRNEVNSGAHIHKNIFIIYVMSRLINISVSLKLLFHAMLGKYCQPVCCEGSAGVPREFEGRRKSN